MSIGRDENQTLNVVVSILPLNDGAWSDDVRYAGAPVPVRTVVFRVYGKNAAFWLYCPIATSAAMRVCLANLKSAPTDVLSMSLSGMPVMMTEPGPP